MSMLCSMADHAVRHQPSQQQQSQQPASAQSSRPMAPPPPQHRSQQLNSVAPQSGPAPGQGPCTQPLSQPLQPHHHQYQHEPRPPSRQPPPPVDERVASTGGAGADVPSGDARRASRDAIRKEEVSQRQSSSEQQQQQQQQQQQGRGPSSRGNGPQPRTGSHAHHSAGPSSRRGAIPPHKQQPSSQHSRHGQHAGRPHMQHRPSASASASSSSSSSHRRPHGLGPQHLRPEDRERRKEQMKVLDRPPVVSTPGSRLSVPKYRPYTRCRSIFSAYRRIKHVGKGQYGSVDKCINRSTNEDVALKKVLMHKETEGFPLLAMREIKLLTQLNHKNVVRLLEIVHSEPTEYNRQMGDVYLVFEYMDYDLGGLLNRGTEFEVREIKCLAKQLFEGLHYLEVNKVIHRDLKVANILLNRKGVLKIADFGLSRLTAKNSRYTLPVCTRWYRPPEVLLGDKHYSHAVDVWSAACIVAELFTGRPIFQGGVLDARTEQDNEIDQFLLICEACGTPTPSTWPGYDTQPRSEFILPKQTFSRQIKEKLGKTFVHRCPAAVALLDFLLVMDPKQRPNAGAALDHHFFWDDPMPCEPSQIRALGADCHEVQDFMSEKRKPKPRRKFKPKEGEAQQPQQQAQAPHRSSSSHKRPSQQQQRQRQQHPPPPPPPAGQRGHGRGLRHAQGGQRGAPPAPSHGASTSSSSAYARGRPGHPQGAQHNGHRHPQQHHGAGGRHGPPHQGSRGSKHLPQHYRHGAGRGQAGRPPAHGGRPQQHQQRPSHPQHPSKRPKMQP